MARQSARFAFTIPAGPSAGLTSGPFVLWVNKEDTYLAPAELGSKWKLSLHGDSSWRWFTTTEDAKSDQPIWPGPGDRGGWEFQPVPFAGGKRLAFVICMFRHALLPSALDAKAVHIEVNDRYDEATLACLWMTEPGVAITSKRRIAGPLTLASGRQVWVSAKTEALPGGQPEPQAVSSMIQPAFPEVDGVASPGVFCRGVHVG